MPQLLYTVGRRAGSQRCLRLSETLLQTSSLLLAALKRRASFETLEQRHLMSVSPSASDLDEPVYAISAPPVVASAGLSDTVSPSLEILGVSPDPRNSSVSSVVFKFSEPVVGFDVEDLILDRAFDDKVDLLTGAQTLTTSDQIRWTLNGLSGLTAAEGLYTLTLRPNGSNIRDLAGNFLAVGRADSWIVDRTAPAVTAVSTTALGTAVGSVAIIFSEVVHNFDVGDLVLSRNGGANLLTGAQSLVGVVNQSFTLNNLAGITAPAGQYTLSLRSDNTVTDAAGNRAAGRTLLSWGADSNNPTVSITQVSNDATGAASSMTFTFSEPVTGFSLADLQLTRGGANLLTGAQTLTTEDSRIWTLGNLSPITSTAGAYTLTLSANGTGIADLAGNVLAQSISKTWTRTVATVGPRATIVDVSPDPRTSAVNSLTISFDQPVQGFTIADLSLRRDGGANLLTAAQSLASLDRKTWTLSNLGGLTAANGQYQLSFTSLSGVWNDTQQVLTFGETEAWSVVAGSLTGAVTPVTPEIRSTPVDSLTIKFSAPVTNLDLSDFSFEANYDGRGNLLTSSQTLTTTDRMTWRLGNLGGITKTPGKYHLLLTNAAGIKDAAGNALSGEVSETFTILPQIKTSDDFLRMIVNGGHHFWEHDKYSSFTPEDGKSYLTVGTRVNYITDPRYNALANPALGLSNNPNALDARDAYQQLYDLYKSEHPEAVVGSYLSAVSVKTPESMTELGQWPPDAMDSREFVGVPLLPSGSGSASNDGYLDVRDPVARQATNEHQVAQVLGLDGRARQDIIYFDEVGYAYEFWDHFVDLFTRLKQVAHEYGSLIGLNLGGWGWADTSSLIGTEVVKQVAQMTDMVTIEGLWNKEPLAKGGSFRTVENTAKITANLRQVMDLGVTVGLLPVDYVNSPNVFNVVNARETTYQGQGALLVTLSTPHHIWPAGGVLSESFDLKGLPAQYKALEGRQWTPVEVPGRPDQVILYNRYNALANIKASAGIGGAISFSTGQFTDNQAPIRLTAALAMMVRRPGDSIFVSAPPGFRPGDLSPTSPDNWFVWPQLLGAPRGDYIVDNSEGGGRILHMYRDFANGRIEIFPLEGWVRVQLWNQSAAADPVVLAAAAFDEAAGDSPVAPSVGDSPVAAPIYGAAAKPLAPVLPVLPVVDHRPGADLARAADRALLELNALDLASLQSIIDEMTL
jgi:hypothetical protein